MTQITLSELPQSLQTLLNQAQKTGETLTIIQDGIPLALISPIKQNKRASGSIPFWQKQNRKQTIKVSPKGLASRHTAI